MFSFLKRSINKSFLSNDDYFIDINPCNEQQIGEFPITKADEVNAVVAKARNSLDHWRSLSRVKRAEYIEKLARVTEREQHALTTTICIETGKSINEANAEVLEAVHMLQVAAATGKESCGQVYASEFAEKDSYVIRKPKGVVAIISPWNFPLAIGSTWCAAPALVEGNVVVHKPSELTPMTAQIMSELYEEVGLSKVYHLIHGNEETGKSLVKSDVNCILFTGSAEVGREIRTYCASTKNVTCSCEMGSKSAVVVFADGDFDMALDASIASAFKLSGQRCVSAGRILIERNIYNKFCDAFADVAKTLKVGDPYNEGVYFGPLISKEAVNKVERYNELSKNEVILVQGNRVNRDGYFITPHVYQTEWKDVPYLKEEVFGPHVALVPFNDLDDAIRIYNDTDFGLAVGVITNDFRRMRICQQRMDAGMVYINGGSCGAESHLPFKGIKSSGYGHASASGTYRAVTDEVAITINYGEQIKFAQGMNK